MSPLETACNYIEESLVVNKRLLESGVLPKLVDAAEKLARCAKEGGKIMLCGNGGSAANAQHLAAEFTNRLRSSMERPPIAALALTTDTSFLTARANDYGFDDVFERLVAGLGRQGDALIGISTSGDSKNVIRAVECARAMDITTVGFLGGSGGVLANMVDLPLLVPSHSTQHIQECHITLGHLLCELIEEHLYGSFHLTTVAAE